MCLPSCFADNDFEVIPAPRNVIVLDDFVSNDLDLDEPWEYIDVDEEKPRGPSYAQIVSRTA